MRYTKRKTTAFLSAVICFILCFSVFGNIIWERFNSAIASESVSETRVVGYLPNWSYQAYTEIDFSALTHINIAFCNVNSSGEIESGIPESNMNAIVYKAHSNNVKVIAALGGGGYGEPYRNLISSADKIDALNTKIIMFCEKYDLDGIDLDIEITSTDSIWKNYGAWVSALRSICDDRGWLLSTATAQWVAGSVTAEIFSLFDYLNVMAYDNDSSGTDSHSSYEFAVECLNYFHTVKSVPKEKLVLGVPFYGRGYDGNGSLDWSSYVSFFDLVKTDEANYNADYFNGVAYTGAVTMREKCALAKEYGGIMIWEITLDAEEEYSLLRVIKEELLSSTSAPDDADSWMADDKIKDIMPWVVITIVIVIAVVTVGIVVFVLYKKKNRRI